MSLYELAVEVYQNAVEHGFYDGGQRNFGEVIALIHSEASEALEEWRKGYSPNYVYYRESDLKPEGIGFEMADILIRVLDWFAANNIDVDQMVKEKMEFNKSRPMMHGKIA